MSLTKEQVRSLVESTSVGAVAYQACALIRELERLNDEEFPIEAVQIRDVLICWPDFILGQLWKIHSANPLGATNAEAVRVRGFGRILHDLFSYIRYLTATAPRQAPPAIQAAINQLITLHFPPANGKPVCVIRPQWQYNLKYVPLTLYLRQLSAPAVIDPDMELPAKTAREMAAALWKWRRNKLSPEAQKQLEEECPAQLAVLSFAGLDTHDSLLYPLLAHELGHFIDYSHDPPLSLSSGINTKAHIPFSVVEAVLTARAPELLLQSNDIWNNVVMRVSVCVRELLADMLALRMMGFGFFVAQSEFLKTIAAWPESLVTPSGYPGTQFRIWSLARHLLRKDFPGNIRAFLVANGSKTSLNLEPLNHYLDSWETRVKYGSDLDAIPIASDPAKAADVPSALTAIAEGAVLNALDTIVDVAIKAIPNGTCASLDSSFFDRVERLEHDLPPTPSHEKPGSFSAIMTAGWAYQLCYGEEFETSKDAIHEQFTEYETTCRLLMKAIELMPAEDAPPKKTVTSDAPELGAVLSRGHIGRRITLPVSHPGHIGVVPFDPSAVEAGSLDVRLGHWFASMRRTRLKGVRLGSPSGESLLRTVGREETFIPRGKAFLIHPGDLVLGVTLEFVALPGDLMAFVEGKSRLGRLGLIVATASTVGPGFHGVVVLELANTGTVPLELEPGMGVAQLVFQKMTEVLKVDQMYRGQFYCQIKP